MQTPPLELKREKRFDFFTRLMSFYCSQLEVWTVVQQILCSPAVSLSHAKTLTLVHPVGDTIKDLVPFTVGGHLHSFCSYVWYEENIVLGNVNLRNTNTAESWYGHIQALTGQSDTEVSEKLGAWGGLNLHICFQLAPRQSTEEQWGDYQVWQMFWKTEIYLFAFVCSLSGGLGIY